MVAAATAPPPNLMLGDAVVRLVNEQVITHRDLEPMRARILRSLLDQAAAKGTTLRPQDRREFDLRAWQQALEARTDELLLLGEADRMGVQADYDKLEADLAEKQGPAQIFADPARTRDILRQQADAQRQMVVMQAAEGQMGPMDPEAVRALYLQRIGRYSRPGQQHVLLVQVRAATDADQARVADLRMRAFRIAQEDPTPAAIKALADPAAYAAADAAGRVARVQAVIDALLAIPAADRQGALGQVVQYAVAAQQAQASLRDEAALRASLETLRSAVAAADQAARAQAFAQAGAALGAAASSDLGWIEPGQKSAALDGQLAAVQPGELTPIFVDAGALCVAMVVERKVGEVRPFAEVAAELEGELRRQRSYAARITLLERLRQDAYIRDLQPAVKVQDLDAANNADGGAAPAAVPTPAPATAPTPAPAPAK